MAAAHLLKKQARSSQKRFWLGTLLVAVAGVAVIVAAFASSVIVIKQSVTTPAGVKTPAGYGETVTGGSIVPGAVLTYGVTIKNEGTTATSENVEFRTGMPPGTTFQRITYPSSATYDSGSRTITSVGSRLQPGHTFSLIYEVKVNSDVAYSTFISENSNLYLGGKFFRTSGTVKNQLVVPTPATPSGFRVSSKTVNSVGLTWGSVSAPAPGTRIAEYVLYRGGAEIARTTSTSYSNTGLTCNTAYSFAVMARAVATQGSGSANSAQSVAAGTTTSACPPGPGVTLRANNSTGTVRVKKGSSLSLSWTTTNSPTSCSASGDWSGSKSKSGGSESRTTDAGTVRTYNYTLTCVNTSGQSAASVRVEVTAPDSTGGGGGGSGGGGTGGGSTGGGSTGGGSTGGGGRSTGGGGSTGGRGSVTPDTTAPTKPGNFLATAGTEGLAINLTWEASTDKGSGVKDYLLERSKDKTTWEKLAENLADISFVDTTAAAETQYFYRLAATDNAGNRSDYASNDYTTGKFVSNLTGEINTLKSEDGLFTVQLSKSATAEGVACVVISEPAGRSSMAKYRNSLVAGPYSLVCKQADGKAIESFNGSVEASMVLDGDAKKAVKKLKKYKNLKLGTVDKAGEFTGVEARFALTTGVISFSLDKPATLILTGTVKSSIWPTILSIFLLILVVGGGIFMLKLRQAQKQQYEEYIRKKYLDL